jgi:hypothetical protein
VPNRQSLLQQISVLISPHHHHRTAEVISPPYHHRTAEVISPRYHHRTEETISVHLHHRREETISVHLHHRREEIISPHLRQEVLKDLIVAVKIFLIPLVKHQNSLAFLQIKALVNPETRLVNQDLAQVVNPETRLDNQDLAQVVIPVNNTSHQIVNQEVKLIYQVAILVLLMCQVLLVIQRLLAPTVNIFQHEDRKRYIIRQLSWCKNYTIFII